VNSRPTEGTLPGGYQGQGRVLPASVRTGSVTGFTNFMNAVIDKAAFDKAAGFIQRASVSACARIIAGGTYEDDSFDQTAEQMIRQALSAIF